MVNNILNQLNFLAELRDLKKRRYNDKIKTDFCLKNNIRLIRMHYTEKGLINSILKNNLYV